MSSSVFLDVKAASKKISRSPGAIRNLVMRQKIPYRKAGGRLMFVEAELDRWILESPGLSLEDWKRGER